MKKSLLLILLAFALAIASAPVTPYAQTNDPNTAVDLDDDGDNDVYVGTSQTSIGARAGFGLDPDQFAFGVQSVLGSISPSSDNFLGSIQFAPSIDVGLGSDLTAVSLNPDLRVGLFTAPNSNLNFYGMVGPSIAFLKPDAGDTDTELGLNLAAGVGMPMGGRNMYNLEARFGLGDIPDFRLLFGVQFGINTSTAANTGAVSR